MVELGPGLYFADVRHDPWCAFLVGRGLCDCLPDIEVKRIEEKDEPAAQPRRRPEVDL
jgi:hypothetical protein